jgi:hypothetical protein
LDVQRRNCSMNVEAWLIAQARAPIPHNNIKKRSFDFMELFNGITSNNCNNMQLDDILNNDENIKAEVDCRDCEVMNVTQ